MKGDVILIEYDMPNNVLNHSLFIIILRTNEIFKVKYKIIALVNIQFDVWYFICTCINTLSLLQLYMLFKKKVLINAMKNKFRIDTNRILHF